MNTMTMDQTTLCVATNEFNFLPRELGAGLVLRFATPQDTEAVAQFYGRVFGRDHFDEWVAAWTRDFMSDQHPAGGAANLTLVEDTRANKIVSAMCLIPQTWTYAGIPFEVGRPEVVATDPDYRRRGLIRAQFDVLHAKSEAMGHMVQGITDIPWYYRQFGYEYALELGGGRVAYLNNIPELKEGEAEPYHIRPMTLEDVPFAAPLFDRECARSLVACPRPEWLWRCLLAWYSPASFACRPFRIIETPDGRPVGYFSTSRELWQNMYAIVELSVTEGQSLRACMPTVLRELGRMAHAEAAEQKKTVTALSFAFGSEHAVYAAIPDMLPKSRLPYGWYIRVPDVPAFLRHIAPVLEARLASSVMAGHSGELKISEYIRGVRLVFENGRLATSEAWNPDVGDEGHAAFPPLSFLRLLFGHKSLSELRAFYADCWAQDEADVLLNILFPPHYSHVIAVE